MDTKEMPKSDLPENIVLQILIYVKPKYLFECIIQNNLNLSESKYNFFWKQRIEQDFHYACDNHNSHGDNHNSHIDWRDFWYLCNKYTLDILFELSYRKRFKESVKYLRILASDVRINKEMLNSAYNHAARENYVDIMKILINNPRVQLRYHDYYALRTAVSMENISIVKLILQDKQIKPNVLNQILCDSCKNNNVDIVKILLADPRIDPTFRNNYSINHAIASGNTKLVKILMSDKRVNLFNTDNLIKAYDKGMYKIVMLLLDNDQVDPSYDNNFMILNACKCGQYDIVKKILLDSRVDSSVNNNFAIVKASLYGYYKIVKLLLADNRVDPSARNNGAIQRAASSGHINIVKLLLADHRVDPSANNNYPLRMASQIGEIEIVKLLLSDERVHQMKYLGIQSAYDNDHMDIVRLLWGHDYCCPREILLDALYYNEPEMIELLLDNKYLVNDLTKTNIIKACEYGDLENVKKILMAEHSNNIIKNIDIAFISACANGHYEIVKLLSSDNRINPNYKHNKAFRWACANGYYEIVKLLLQDNRIDPADKNNDAFICASENSHIAIVELLLADTRVNPRINNNQALRTAISSKNVRLIKLLLADERINITNKKI
jgi:ankyrin repeat protein